jgi:hypothetical protein
MRLCNKCDEPTQEFEGEDMCINCGCMEGETHEEDNEIELYNPLLDVINAVVKR